MLAIHWRPPLDNGGSPIERYIIEKREAERSAWTHVGISSRDVTTYAITNLQENQFYYFRVLAENAYGFSDPLTFDAPVVPKRIFGEFHIRFTFVLYSEMLKTFDSSKSTPF